MGRLRVPALIALFALFCGPLAGSAGASSGTPPKVGGGFPPLIGDVLTATASVSGDSVAWAQCNTFALTDPATATATAYSLTQADAGHELCAYEIDGTSGLVTGISDPIGAVGLVATLS